LHEPDVQHGAVAELMRGGLKRLEAMFLIERFGSEGGVDLTERGGAVLPEGGFDCLQKLRGEALPDMGGVNVKTFDFGGGVAGKPDDLLADLEDEKLLALGHGGEIVLRGFIGQPAGDLRWGVIGCAELLDGEDVGGEHGVFIAGLEGADGSSCGGHGLGARFGGL
jgi:hypothetical protein